MNTRKSTLLLASLALSAWPMAATAQQGGDEKSPEIVTNSEVELGVGATTSDDFYANEYTGIEDTDPYFFGNIDIQQRAAYDSDSAHYVDILGIDLGLPSESLRIEAGKQGSFSIFGEYNAIPHLRYNDGQTPYDGAGSTELSLPPGFAPGADTTAIAADLTAALKDVDIGTERERIGAGFSVNLTPEWTLSTSFRSEEKDGIEAIAGLLGSSGGNFRVAILPRPVDFTTQEAELAVGYSGDRLQANVTYNLSVFDNNQNLLNWESAYTTYSATEGQLALEPNNMAHRLSATVGYRLDDQTRLTGNLTLGRMLQDDDFLPYTINPLLAVPEALPRDSLDGEVNTIRANVGVTTKLTDSLDLKAAYTYDDRDNKTPVDTYLTVPNDVADQALIDEVRARVNMPYSKQSHEVELEAGYRVTADTKLTFGYDFEAINRDLSEVEDTQEHTFRAKARSSLTDTVGASLGYEYAMRTGSTYDSTVPFYASHSDEHLAIIVPDDAYEQNPYTRKFYMADRNSHLLTGRLNYLPNDQLALGLSGSYKLSDYNDSVMGLTESNYGSATIDASYQASRSVNLSGFVTYDRMENVQVGYARSGTVTILPGDPLIDAGSQGLWEETITDQSVVAGFEVDWAMIENKLDVVLDISHARTETGFEFATNIPGVLPLPDVTSTLTSLGIRGDYNMTEGVTFRMGYRYEKLEVSDFALDYTLLPDPEEIMSTSVFGLGNGEPDYDAHVVAASIVVKF